MGRLHLTERSEQYTACEGCKKRAEGCHSGCEDYAKEVILGTILEADARKEEAKRLDEYSVHAARAWRVVKSNPRCKKYMLSNGYIRNRGGR